MTNASIHPLASLPDFLFLYSTIRLWERIFPETIGFKFRFSKAVLQNPLTVSFDSSLPSLSLVFLLAHSQLAVVQFLGVRCLSRQRIQARLYRKLALVGINPNQILFSFSSDKDRRTDFVAQWLERATRFRMFLGSIPGGAALWFFVWSGCQFFYLCRSWKRREFD